MSQKQVERKVGEDGILTEVQHQKGAVVTLHWLNGVNYPPSVTIKNDDGELIHWNFFYNYWSDEKGYYAEGIGRAWTERKRFYKCPSLGKDREKAIDMYYRLIAQTKKPKKGETNGLQRNDTTVR